jgi:hypothetical protein
MDSGRTTELTVLFFRGRLFFFGNGFTGIDDCTMLGLNLIGIIPVIRDEPNGNTRKDQ